MSTYVHNQTSDRHRSLLMACDHRIVAGIDFGTTHSGFVFEHVASPDRIECFYDWENQLRPYCKNATAIWFNIAEKKVDAWGYTAIQRALEAKDEERKTHHLVDDLKSLVEPDAPSRTKAIPPGVDGLDLVAGYLRKLHELLLEKLHRTFGESLGPKDIHYCLTVPGKMIGPSIWSEVAKQNLREAAAHAGLVESSEINKPRLGLVLEPEAAAVYCSKNLRNDAETAMSNGDTFMIVDAGGGTVDIVVEQCTESDSHVRLSELAKGEGDWCGSTFVDKRFEKWFEDKIGLEPSGKDRLTILAEWENLKRQFKGPESFARVDHLTLSIPARLYNEMYEMSDAKKEELEEAQDGVSEEIYIALQDMQTFFDPIVDQVLGLVEKQLERCTGKRCNKMFAVGGFSASQYLFDKLQHRFAHSFDSFACPSDPGSAILQGAVLSGLDPRCFHVRCSRFTYGFPSSFPANYLRLQTGKPVNPSDAFIHRENGSAYASIFCPVISANQAVRADDSRVEHRTPLYSWMTSLTLPIYATRIEYAAGEFMCESDAQGLFKVGTVEVPNIPLQGDRIFELTFYFGLTELTVVAKVNATGVETRVAVQFAAG
ncbi:hypothetical protein HKX48_003670 [Thoreauomyces humboldtii]|nr:hypothetical protein HKX48_003670 [Thoreauomyces humboldtii]